MSELREAAEKIVAFWEDVANTTELNEEETKLMQMMQAALSNQPEPDGYICNGLAHRDHKAASECKDCIPLYTSPPTVSLSDDEILMAWCNIPMDGAVEMVGNAKICDFARAIEAKLKGV